MVPKNIMKLRSIGEKKNEGRYERIEWKRRAFITRCKAKPECS